MSVTAYQPYGGTPASDIAMGSGTREEGGVGPPAEMGDTARFPMPAEAAEAPTAEAQAGNVGGGEVRRSRRQQHGDREYGGQPARRAHQESPDCAA